MNVNDVKVWAFLAPSGKDERMRPRVYKAVKDGKSRFGWSWAPECNLNSDPNRWPEGNGKQLFLLDIKPRDWIVHINMPGYGKCIAAQVVSEYQFDEGIDFSVEYSESDSPRNFCHFFEIDPTSRVEFDRNDWCIHPDINLKPRYRYHRVYAVKEFLMAIECIRSGRSRTREEGREQHHLWNDAEKLLKEITSLIHKTHKAKKLEGFLAEVFKRIPGVVDVEETGSRWGPDYGRDLSVTARVSVGRLDFEHKIVVQVKSHEGETSDTTPVEQIKKAICRYRVNSGMIVTTGERTERLEEAVTEAANELGCPIDLLAGKEVAQFVIKNAADMVFRLS